MVDSQFQIRSNCNNPKKQTNQPHILQISLFQPIISISCGHDFTLLLTHNNQVLSFGSNTHGQLGYPSANPSHPQPLTLPIPVTHIACGHSHALAHNSHQIMGWGQHEYGALGYAPEQVVNKWHPRKVPLFVGAGQQILSVSCGRSTTAVDVSGGWYCMGDNRQGQLGLILRKGYYEIEKVELQRSAGVVAVGCGDEFTVGLDAEGNLYGAGMLAKLELQARKSYTSLQGLSPLFSLATHKPMGKYRRIIKASTHLALQDTQGSITVYGYAQGETKLQPGAQQLVCLHEQGYVVAKSEAIYEWRNGGKAVLQLDETGQGTVVEAWGNGTVVVVSVGQCSGSAGGEEREKHRGKETRFSGASSVVSNNSILMKCKQDTTQYPVQVSRQLGTAQETTALHKQILQQKQIIKLYEAYVTKLEQQNQTLKAQLQPQPKQEQPQSKQEQPRLPQQNRVDQLGEQIQTIRNKITVLIQQYKPT